MNTTKSYAGKAWMYLTLAIVFYTAARFLPKDNLLGLSLGVGLEIGSFILLPFIAIFFIRARRNRKRTIGAATSLSTPTAPVSQIKRSQTALAVAIIAAAALIAGAIYFVKAGDAPNPLQAIFPGRTVEPSSTINAQEDRKNIVQNCAKRVEEMRQEGEKESLDCYFKTGEILRKNPDSSGVSEQVFRDACEERKVTVAEEEQFIKRCLRQNGIE